jgi:hypothetical protein
MPLARYFSIVGGVLLALLVILDAYFPALPVAAKPKVHLPVIRIHTDRKWPERIAYDTSLPTIVPASIASVDADAIPPTADLIVDASAAARELAAFAMLPSSVSRTQDASTKVQQHKPRHYRKVTRKRAPAPRIAMVRHPQFGWFGRSFW